MPDPLLTTAHVSLLQKLGGFFAGFGKDTEDAGKIIGTVIADVATIKGQIGDGDYIAIVGGLQSDIAALKSEVSALTTQVKASINPAPATTATTATETK